MSSFRKRPPDWVPQVIISLAGAMRGVNPDVCDRLLTDQEMQAVWTELGQHEVERLPADLPDNHRASHWLDLAEAPPAKDEAIVAFFAAVVIETALKNKPRMRKDITDLAVRFADAAEMARIVRLDPFARPPGADVDALKATETLFAQIAEDIERGADGHPLVLVRARKDDETRVFVRSIAKMTKSIFGQYLYGTLASVTNVALRPNIDLDAAKVRDWCEGLEPCQ